MLLCEPKGCHASSGGLPTRFGGLWTGLTHRPSWSVATGGMPAPAPPTTTATPVATPPPGSISRWEALRGGLLAFLVVMAIILLTLGFIALFVLAPFLGF